ncbi:MAG: DUF3048 domain-containing protein [Chloroflexota bacterium]|nr:MAG: DUF3048 domain-containing protein [Chloroflexota bacterium]
MKKVSVIILIAYLFAACSSGGPTPTAEIAVQQSVASATTTQPEPSATPVPPTETATATITPTATPPYPEEGFGPDNFPSNVNPLTGEFVADERMLDKRPVAIKINIVPRTGTRPPWGLSQADIVFDYYQNNGYTRFHTIYYGEDTELAGPVRSARFPDHFLIRMYKSIFAYGSADPLINERLFSAEYSDRLVLEGGGDGICPPDEAAPLCRFDPQGYAFLLGGTSEIHRFIDNEGVDDSRQNLDGMYFNLDTPSEGQSGENVSIRYSGDSYALWEYEKSSGNYLRNQDDSYDQGAGETYAPLLDRNNDLPITADNVVVLLMEHAYFRKPPAEIVEILISGSGPAYIFRDGKVYEVRWNVPGPDRVLYLTDLDGNPFPYKPGNTWYQIIGQSSEISEPEEGAWRFEFLVP